MSPKASLLIGGVVGIFLLWFAFVTLRDTLRQFAPVAPPMIPVVESSDPVTGDPTGKTVIILYEDFHCPACAELASDVKTLLHDVPKGIQIVWKDAPISRLHPGARATHIAARCAGEQGKFWEFHDAVFARLTPYIPQGSIPITEADHEAIAADLKLDQARWRSCRNRSEWNRRLDQRANEMIQLGITELPTVFVNGAQHKGKLTSEVLGVRY